MVNQGTGNIAYSFNKNSFYNIIEGNKTLFILNYILVIFISTFFLTGSFFMTGLSVDRYITPNDENSQNSQNSQNGQIGQTNILNPEKNQEDKKSNISVNRSIYNYFKDFCLESPMNIINMPKDGIEEILTQEEIKEGKKPTIYIGFSEKSYLFIIITQLIGIFIIVEAQMKNMISSIIVNFVQENPNNNPYNNPNCISKTSDSVTTYINANYSKLFSLSFLFIIPFLTTFVLRKIINADKYDIKKSAWIKYYIFLSLIIPTIILVIYRLTGHSSITLFSTIYPFIEQKDEEYIKFLTQIFNLNFFIIYMFLFVIFIFLILHWIYNPINKKIKKGWKRTAFYIFIVFFIYILVPYLLSTNAVSTLFYVFKDNNVNKNEEQISSNIEKNGCQSLLDYIIKYNYLFFNK